jgi:hypothetical protein
MKTGTGDAATGAAAAADMPLASCMLLLLPCGAESVAGSSHASEYQEQITACGSRTDVWYTRGSYQAQVAPHNIEHKALCLMINVNQDRWHVDALWLIH